MSHSCLTTSNWMMPVHTPQSLPPLRPCLTAHFRQGLGCKRTPRLAPPDLGFVLLLPLSLLPLSLFLSLALSLSRSLSLSLALSRARSIARSRALTHSLTLSLFHSHSNTHTNTHTHTHIHTNVVYRDIFQSGGWNSQGLQYRLKIFFFFVLFPFFCLHFT
jgi:hypothetical protein